MKHIKKFEVIGPGIQLYKEGQYVVLLQSSSDEFNVGDIYEIERVDVDDTIDYKIIPITGKKNINDYYWAYQSEIREEKPYEVDQIK